MPLKHQWHPGTVAEEPQEVVIEGIGNDHDVLVGGLPGVDEDQWEVLDEELYGSQQAAAEALKHEREAGS